MSSRKTNESQPADITNLQESFNKQQEKISALKELVRKSGAAHDKTAAQEKVKNIAAMLMKSKARSRQGLNVSTYSTEPSTSEAQYVSQEQLNVLSVSQCQLPLDSPVPSHSSTPNPTPLKPQTSAVSAMKSNTTTTPHFSTTGSEKIALMRQQLEQNKLRMAQKASSKQHLEQLVSQLKEKFDSTQQCLEDTSELGKSMTDLSQLIYTPVSRERHKSATDLTSQTFNLERERIKFLENRCRLLEKQLEKEKQINNRNGSSLAAESKVVELRIHELEATLIQKQNEYEGKQTEWENEIKMLKDKFETEMAGKLPKQKVVVETDLRLTTEVEDLTMQLESFKSENVQLSQQIHEQQKQMELKVCDLSEQKAENDRLKTEIETLSKQMQILSSETPDVSEVLSTNLGLQKEIEYLKSQLENATENKYVEQNVEIEQLKNEKAKHLKQIKDLQDVNDMLETANSDMTSKANMGLTKAEESSTEDIDAKLATQMAGKIQQLTDENTELRHSLLNLETKLEEQEKGGISDVFIAEKIAKLEEIIESQKEDLLKAQENLNKNEEDLMERNIEYNVLKANFDVLEEKYERLSKYKPFASSAGSPETEHENQQLKQKLDESNKAMIKLKLKCKQTEKQIEKLKKGSDLHAEVVKLAKEKEQLQQKLTELEDEKGQWQLAQIEGTVGQTSSCGHVDILKDKEENIMCLSKQLKETEDLLESFKQGEQTRVKSELSEIKLEEQVLELNTELSTCRTDIEAKIVQLQTAHDQIVLLNKQKDELDKKLEHYLNENMELLDKVEKLSKSSSSAESIEIVERLTHQETQELEEFNKRLEESTQDSVNSSSSLPHKEAINELTQTEMNPEITETFNKLREEGSELMNKIELFTTERREVLEKMDHLREENQELLKRIEQLSQEKVDLETNLALAEQKQETLTNKLQVANKEKDSLTYQIAESRAQKAEMSKELTSLQQSSEVVAALDNGETLFEKCEKSLVKLNSELEAYRKANDKKAKFHVSKKLAKEAENAHTQLSELLQKVKEASTAVETVTVVETVVAVTAPNGKALAEYEQLTAQNRELKSTIQELRRLLDEARDRQDDADEEAKAAASHLAIQQATTDEEDLQETIQKLADYETQLTELQSKVEDLTQELYESRTATSEKSEEIVKINAELENLKKLNEDFDGLINDKEMAHEKQIEQLTRLRKQLEAKCDTYEQEMAMLQTLVKEQKEQLIEAYKENESELNEKLSIIQQQEEQSEQMRSELIMLKQNATTAGNELAQELRRECEQLKESLKIQKNLVQQQVDELSNKQETIDTLNQQIIDLYKTMEENASKVLEKEDEISYLQEITDANKAEYENLQQALSDMEKKHHKLEQLGKQQKDEVNEREQELNKIKSQCSQTIAKNEELEKRNKEQLEKLKKYAANLKKKAQQCQEYEMKLKEMLPTAQRSDTNQDLEELNLQLRDKIQTFENELQNKSKELDEMISVRNALEKHVDELNSKILGLEQQTSDWGDAADLEQIQEQLMVTQEQLKNKIQESVELRDALKVSENMVEELQAQLILSQQTQSDFVEIEQLKNELESKQDKITQLELQSTETKQKHVFECEELRKKLESAQNSILQLENKLISATETTSDWGNFNESDQLKEEFEVNELRVELTCCQENLALKIQEIEELRQSLMAAKEQLSQQTQSDFVEIEQLKNELKSKQDKITQLELQSTETKQKHVFECEELRKKLESAQNSILQLENKLISATETTSDWGNFNESDQLKEEFEVNELRVELTCCQENLALKIQEIEELRQSLMAAKEQLTNWGNETPAANNDDHKALSSALANKEAQLEKTELALQELQNEVFVLREKDLENTQKISELNLKLQFSELSPGIAEQKLMERTEELKAKSLKFEKSKAVIKERNNQIQRLHAQIKDLQEKLSHQPEEEILSPTTQKQLDAAAISSDQALRNELETVKESYNKLNEKYLHEKANFQETITRLETLHDGIQAKLQEDMSYIESLEQENAKFKDKICRLEECVACFEERRASMERRVNLMDAQIQSSTEMHTKTEDELIYRLNMLSEHDDVIAQRLLDSHSEKEVLEENYRVLQTQFNELQALYNKVEKEFREYQRESSNDYEQEMLSLREQLAKAHCDIERQKAVYDAKLAVKATEIDELEAELSEQLDKLNADKKHAAEQLERMTDECTAHQNDILHLHETVNTLEQAKSELERESSWLRMQSENSQQDLYDLQELRMQSLQDKTELENLRHQIDSLTTNHESELQALRTQITELDSLRMQVGQNQTDDQVFIETENKRLTDLLAEKEAIIENYQRQNLQLQMAAAASASTNDPFSLAFGVPTQQQSNSSQQQLAESHELQRLSHELVEKTNLVQRLQQDLNNLQAEFNILLEGNQEMQRQLSESHTQALQNSAETQSNIDVIPAPPMFFSTEAAMRSPFDDLLTAAQTQEQPTIEDLQRNVSDLEKHAQDLEHKLFVRNQRESEYEDRLRDRDTLLHQSQVELQKIQEDHSRLLLQQSEMSNISVQINELREQVNYLQNQLKERDQELEKVKCERDEEILKKTAASLDRQMIATESTIDPALQPTLDMFFGNSSASSGFDPFASVQSSSEPVVEAIIVPKKTYHCHPEIQQDNRQAAVTALDLTDDWGDSWGNPEATAEAEHFAKQSATLTGASPAVSLITREQQLELQLQEFQERLQELEMSLERSEEQKKELHVKSGKLMKKLKEYKIKIDELQLTSANNTTSFRKSASVESSSMFSDLDAAIQDELKTQIKTLEEKLEEQKKEKETFSNEKEKLLKRIDVLTAGNERITEMKERQDMEVQMYQARIRELQQKLNSLDDWGNDEPSEKCDNSQNVTDKTPENTNAATQELIEKCKALTLEVQDLNGDRLELQALLDEEKSNTAKAEDTIASLRVQLTSLQETQSMDKSSETTKLNNLKLDLQNAQESFNNIQSINDKLASDLKSQTDTLALSQANELRLTDELNTLQAEVENLRETLNNTKQNLIELEAELAQLKELKEKQIDAVKEHSDESEKLVLREELNKLTEEISLLRTQNQEMQEKIQVIMAENEYLKNSLIPSTANQDNLEDLTASLQEKESEIEHLKQRVNDLMNEDQTEKLVLEILTKNQEIQMLKLQVKDLEDDKLELENNLSLQITKDMAANKDAVDASASATGRQQELEKQVSDLLNEKLQMEEELQVLNNHVLESLQQEDKMKALTLELDTKNIEILELRKSLDSIKNTTAANVSSSPDYAALNAQWEAIVDQRCGEIAKMWQDHLAQRERDYQLIQDHLKEEIALLKVNQRDNITIESSSLPPLQVSAETSVSSTPASETTTNSASTSAEASKDGTPLSIRSADSDATADAMIEKMQAALEAQEMEIVTLKEQLAIRSAEYARLAAQIDPFKLHNASSHIAVANSIESKRLSAAASDMPMVPKSELDFTLYMLHQRDMRCEEMTLELVSLLEERDTLQLKLSNTLRQLEATKTGLGSPEVLTPVAAGSAVESHHSPSDNISRSSVAGSTLGSEDYELNQKLSQLQTVDHSKDKLIKEEHEQRIRQMFSIQQDVAKMPPAALSELIGSDLSQSNQSPSTVLLNWLWGNKSGGGPSSGSQPNL